MRSVSLSNAFKIRWVLVINQILGFVLFSEFLSLYAAHFFQPTGFAARLTDLAAQSQISWVKSLLLLAAQHSVFCADVMVVVFAVTAVAMMFSLANAVFNWIGFAIFFCYYLAHISYPGTWLFEYLLPSLFYLICAFAAKSEFKYLPGRYKILGTKIYSGIGSIGFFIAYGLMGLTFDYAMTLSQNAGSATHTVSLIAAATFVVASWLSIRFDCYRYRGEMIRQKALNAFPQGLDRPWLNYMIISVGVMLVCQVYMNQLLNWFTLSGYHNLLETYAHYTHIPGIFVYVLHKSASSYAHVLLPIQQAVESFGALCLLVLLLRFPMVLIMSGLFFALAFIEFGIPGTWPATSHSELTWLWELLLPAIVALIIGLYEFFHFITAKTLKERWIGEGFVHKTVWQYRVVRSLMVAILVWVVIIISPALGANNFTFAASSSLTVFFYLLLLDVIAIMRHKENAKIARRF